MGKLCFPFRFLNYYANLVCVSVKQRVRGRSAEWDEGMVVLFNLFQPFCFGEPLSNALHNIDEIKMR